MPPESDRLHSLDQMRIRGIDPYPGRCNRTHRIEDLKDGESATISGKLSALTDGGGTLLDESGTVALSIDPNPGDNHSVQPYLESGDWIEAKGFLREGLFRVSACRILTKSIGPAVDFDRFSAGYNRLRDILRLRALTLIAVRRYFEGEGFLEVETPLLVSTSGQEPHLIPFESEYLDNHHSGARYLATSPEYAMKRLLASGFERIYQICKSFRNGEDEQGPTHNPEFTILEWYRAFASYEDIMIDVEQLVAQVSQDVLGTTRIEFGSQSVDLTPPWERIPVRDAVLKYAGIDIFDHREAPSLTRCATDRGFSTIALDDSWDVAFFKVFLEAVEPNLGQEKPVILTDYPASMSALSKMKPSSPDIAERFEIYIAGVEMANAFTELNDPREQRARFLSEQEQRRSDGGTPPPIDDRFLGAMESGIPPAGGIALGVDRLVMLLANVDCIRDVIAFPFDEI